MHGLHQSPGEIDRATQAVIAQITDWSADHARQLGPVQISLTQARVALNVADGALDVEEGVLEAKRRVYGEALRNLDRARRIANDNPGLIAVNERLLLEQIGLASDAAADAARIANEVNREIDGLQRRINDLQGRVADAACHLLIEPNLVRACRRLFRDLNRQIANLQDQISGAELRRRAAADVAREAANLRDEIREQVARLKNELDEAVRNLNNKCLSDGDQRGRGGSPITGGRTAPSP